MQRLPDSSATKPPFVVAMLNRKVILFQAIIPLLASSRDTTEAERGAFRSRRGYDPMEIPIALDAVGIYVNRENPIKGLTMAQVDAIFGADRNWGILKP